MVNPKVSTHDAVCALTWRAITLSRYATGIITNLNEHVEFHMPTDVRRYINLPNAYIGNAVYYVTCNLSLKDLLDPTSLPKVASMIRSALDSRSKERIAGWYTLLKSLPDVRQARSAWANKMHTTAFVIGSSWRADSMYSADWGEDFGPVIRCRSPDVRFFGALKG